MITLLSHYFRSETESAYIFSNEYESQMNRQICIDEKKKNMIGINNPSKPSLTRFTKTKTETRDNITRK